MSLPLSKGDDEYRSRERDAVPLMEQVFAFLKNNLNVRICHRSSGNVTLTFFWRDGHLKEVKETEDNFLRLGEHGRLPGCDGVDSPVDPA